MYRFLWRFAMSLASIKLELLREKNSEKISQIKSLGFQTVPINDLTDRQITTYLANNNCRKYY